MKANLTLKLIGVHVEYYGYFEYITQRWIADSDGKNRLTGKKMFDSCNEEGITIRKSFGKYDEKYHVKTAVYEGSAQVEENETELQIGEVEIPIGVIFRLGKPKKLEGLLDIKE